MRVSIGVLAASITWTALVAQTNESGEVVTASSWKSLDSGVDVSLRGLSAVDSDVAWASGQRGTVLRTIDAGATWTNVSVPDADALDFRDIEAFDAESAVVMSAGAPARFYKTTNGGATWREVYANDAPGVFFDAMAFWEDGRGLAFSDPVDGRLLIVKTEDHGDTWRRIDPARIPPALEGEGGFAASGTCLSVADDDLAWIGLGGPAARIFFSRDAGEHWEVLETPMAHSPSAGIFSVTIGADGRGVAVGGDYAQPEEAVRNAMFTTDAGQQWALCDRPPRGYRSAVVALGEVFIATGPTGTDVSRDGGRVWEALVDGPGYHALSATDEGVLWAAGADGRIGRMVLPPR